MRITEISFAVLRMQYRIARVPLQLIEDRVVTRLDHEAPVRLMYERSFGAIDAAVGGVLGDSEIAMRGSALVERSGALGKAQSLDAAAARERQQADDELRESLRTVMAEKDEARERSEQRVADARGTAEQRKQHAADTAEERTAAAKARVDEAAMRRGRDAEAAKRAKESRITAEENAKVAVADTRLDDAADKRRQAAAKRAHADRVEDLADVEKEKRRAER